MTYWHIHYYFVWATFERQPSITLRANSLDNAPSKTGKGWGWVALSSPFLFPRPLGFMQIVIRLQLHNLQTRAECPHWQ